MSKDKTKGFPQRKPMVSQRTKTANRRKKFEDKKKKFLWSIVVEIEEKKSEQH